MDPPAGTVPSGASADASVTFDAAGLFGGDYLADLVVASNDPLSPEVIVSTTLHVTGAPDIDVDPLAVDFGPIFIGAATTSSVSVSNAGTELLTVEGAGHNDFFEVAGEEYLRHLGQRLRTWVPQSGILERQ